MCNPLDSAQIVDVDFIPYVSSALQASFNLNILLLGYPLLAHALARLG